LFFELRSYQFHFLLGLSEKNTLTQAAEHVESVHVVVSDSRVIGKRNPKLGERTSLGLQG